MVTPTVRVMIILAYPSGSATLTGGFLQTISHWEWVWGTSESGDTALLAPVAELSKVSTGLGVCVSGRGECPEHVGHWLQPCPWERLVVMAVFAFQYKVLSVLPGSGMGIAVSTPSTQKVSTWQMTSPPSPSVTRGPK